MKEKITKNTTARNLRLIAVFIALFVFYGWYHTKVSISSDTVTTYPMSLDLAKGNILLKGWVLGTNNFYFTEIIPYAIGHLLGFSGKVLINWVPGISWALTTVCAYLLFEKQIKESGKKSIIIQILYICLFAVIAITASYTLLNANSHNNLYALLMLWLLLFERYIKEQKKRYLIGMTILGIMMEFSEGVTTMVLVGPVFCFSLLKFLINKEHEYIPVLTVDIIIFAGGKLLVKIFRLLGGMITIGMSTKIVSPSAMIARLPLWIREVGTLTGCEDIFANTNNIYEIAAIIIISLMLMTVIVDMVRYRHISWQEQLIFWIALLNAAACDMTDVAIYQRYIVPAYYFAIILVLMNFLRLLNYIKIKTAENILMVIATASGVIFCGYKLRDIGKLATYDNTASEAVKVIKENNLGNGYADFWAGPPVAFESDYDIDIYPVEINENDNKIEQYPELVKRSWYKKKNIHYLISFNSTAASIFIDEDRMTDILGEPDQVYTAGQYAIYYWNEDISDKLSSKTPDEEPIHTK